MCHSLDIKKKKEERRRINPAVNPAVNLAAADSVQQGAPFHSEHGDISVLLAFTEQDRLSVIVLQNEL